MKNIDVNLITENFVEILTNTINIASLFHDMFFSETPEDVELEQYIYDGTKLELQSTLVPNLAKMKEELKEAATQSEATSTKAGVVKIDDSTIVKNSTGQICVPIDNNSIVINSNDEIAVDKENFVPDRALNSDITYKIINVHDSVTPLNFWLGTQVQYDAITDKDPDTVYFISQS